MAVIVYLHELRSIHDQSATVAFQETFPLAADTGRLVQPLTGSVALHLDRDYLIVQGKLQGRVELVCDRCLGHFESPLTVSIDEAIPLSTAGDVVEDSWTVSLVEVIGKQETVNITELVRQYTVLAVPTRRLCSPTCRLPGSPPAPLPIDPRLQKLAELLPGRASME